MDPEHTGFRGWLLEHSGIEESVCEVLLAQETRPRSATLEDGLLVILRGVNLNPGADPEDMVSLRLWVHPIRVYNLSRRPLIAIQELAEAIDRDAGP